MSYVVPRPASRGCLPSQPAGPLPEQTNHRFGLVDVRVVAGIIQRDERGVGIMRQQGPLIFKTNDLIPSSGDEQSRPGISAEYALRVVIQPITGVNLAQASRSHRRMPGKIYD